MALRESAILTHFPTIYKITCPTKVFMRPSWVINLEYQQTTIVNGSPQNKEMLFAHNYRCQAIKVFMFPIVSYPHGKAFISKSETPSHSKWPNMGKYFHRISHYKCQAIKASCWPSSEHHPLQAIVHGIQTHPKHVEMLFSHNYIQDTFCIYKSNCC